MKGIWHLLALSICSLGLVGAHPALGEAGSRIKSDEEVVFFTTTAHWSRDAWEAPVHGWIFEPENGSLWRSAIAKTLRKTLRVAKDQEALFRTRLMWFLVDNERGKRITVRVGGVERTLGKSGADGHFSGSLRIPPTHAGPQGGHSLRIRAKTRSGDRRHFEGTVMLVGEEGLSIISDIDDTIKVTGAYSRQLTLERTFLHEFQEVQGMASAYRKWSREGAAFHYVSASPWHLFVPLSRFMRRTSFPLGSVHLRDFRLKSDSRWNLLKSSRSFKTRTIEELLERYPKRKFILIGDTGERDPEIYSEIAEAHTEQIEAIYLRLARTGDMSAERRLRTIGRHGVPVTIFSKAGALEMRP